VAGELVNQLEAVPALKAKIRAAARVGTRRWTLYLDNGVTVLLPEHDVEAALALAGKLDSTQGLLSKGITSLDLRLADRVTVAVAEVLPAEPGER
jgi:cell division protein FtsQ